MCRLLFMTATLPGSAASRAVPAQNKPIGAAIDDSLSPTMRNQFQFTTKLTGTFSMILYLPQMGTHNGLVYGGWVVFTFFTLFDAGLAYSEPSYLQGRSHPVSSYRSSWRAPAAQPRSKEQ